MKYVRGRIVQILTLNVFPQLFDLFKDSIDSIINSTLRQDSNKHGRTAYEI